MKLSRAAGQAHQTLTAMAVLGRTYEMQGALRRAAATYREALDLASGPGDRPVPFAGMAYVGLAGPLYEWNDLDNARHYALEGMRLSEMGGFVAYEVAGGARLAAVYQAQGDGDKAIATLRRAEQLAMSRDYGLVRALIDELRVRLWIAKGNIAAAGQWARAHRRDPGWTSTRPVRSSKWRWPGCSSSRESAARPGTCWATYWMPRGLQGERPRD